MLTNLSLARSTGSLDNLTSTDCNPVKCLACSLHCFVNIGIQKLTNDISQGQHKGSVNMFKVWLKL